MAAMSNKQSTILGSGSKAMMMTMQSDLSAHWKLLGRGGATKVHKNPCHLCDVHDDSLLQYSINYSDCKWCSQLLLSGKVPRSEFENKTWRCMHRNVLCSSSLNDLKAELISNEQSLLNNEPPLELLPGSILRPLVDFNNPTQFDLDQKNSVCYNLNYDAVTTNMKNGYFFR